ncbi:MAG: methylated-DNA--[protein]-cysteine S-methyltransferase [Tannerella sp.]|jgi:methylated-DNA-[protein]-cysteine S-methyltransferase|nr:methylated-DNA--[protein]-cysteine S-methyltransferase [Tannerella sp.]
MKIQIKQFKSPCGELLLGSFDDKLCLCNWTKGKRKELIAKRLQTALNADYEESESEVINETVRQLEEYFGKKRQKFNVPLLFAGTDFQKVVWRELLKIPYGTTVSYGELARRIGMPKAVRAVAAANGANAISIFAPCHRVIGSNNKLVGYGGGLEAKKWLLELETF